MAWQSRLGASIALVVFWRGFVARSGCFVSSGPSLRGLGGGFGRVGRSAALDSIGSRPLPSELPRVPTAAPSGIDGAFSGAWVLSAALCAAAAAIRHGKRRQQPRNVSAAGGRDRAWDYIYGSEPGVAKCPAWIDPQSQNFGLFGKTKFDIPPWLTESKWRSLGNTRLKTRHPKWYMQYFDKDGMPAYNPKMYYNFNDAVDILIGFAERSAESFTRTVECSMFFNLDQKFPDQQIRTSIKLPHGTGQQKRVAVFCAPEEEQEALDLGACAAGLPLANAIEEGDIEFDILIAKPQMMPKLAKLGRILGPRKLMPSPKSGTVVTDYKAAIEEFKAGATLEVRTNPVSVINVPVAKISMGKQKIIENLQALTKGLVDKAPTGAKSIFWKTFFLKITKSPTIKIDRKILPNPAVQEEED